MSWKYMFSYPMYDKLCKINFESGTKAGNKQKFTRSPQTFLKETSNEGWEKVAFFALLQLSELRFLICFLP